VVLPEELLALVVGEATPSESLAPVRDRDPQLPSSRQTRTRTFFAGSWPLPRRSLLERLVEGTADPSFSSSTEGQPARDAEDPEDVGVLQAQSLASSSSRSVSAARRGRSTVERQLVDRLAAHLFTHAIADA